MAVSLSHHERLHIHRAYNIGGGSPTSGPAAHTLPASRTAMMFVLVDHDDLSTSSEASTGDQGSVSDLQLFPSGGHYYRPATVVTAACALRWLPFAAAVSAARALLGASHEDLRLRPHQLSRALSHAFFGRDDAAAPTCCPIGGGGGARFPEDGLYVCVDLPPLCPALLAVQRALMQVVVKEASHDPCGWYYDTLGEAMRLLVGDDDGGGLGPVVFDRVKFEAAFALEWAEMT